MAKVEFEFKQLNFLYSSASAPLRYVWFFDSSADAAVCFDRTFWARRTDCEDGDAGGGDDFSFGFGR
ncbi:MAG: hypothetical protein UY21_C0006G0025 [Microgenomates group bacterium GW2011_GWA1_48_10]|nr:MAG: hypothetical protein UY21_C0006G0025 [Microgenomates group bacterium GW2011_GWA1_48_10]